MRLTNEQIEFIIRGKTDDMLFEITGAEIKEKLSEILSLRKELEQTKKELEQVINEESDGVNGVV